jgi:hypothetical protein
MAALNTNRGFWREGESKPGWVSTKEEAKYEDIKNLSGIFFKLQDLLRSEKLAAQPASFCSPISG